MLGALVGLGALPGVGGCGRAGNETVLRPDPLGPAANGDVGAGDPDPSGELPDGDGLPPEGEGTPGSGGPDVVAPSDARQDVLLAVIERECGRCHVGADADPAGDLSSIPGLVASGMIWPGSGETSRLALWLQYGDSRAEHAQVFAGPGEYSDIVGFINDYERDRLEACPDLGVASRDTVAEWMLADILERPEADRRFIRYFDLTHATNDGACGGRLGRLADALFEAINAVSLAPAVQPPLTTPFEHERRFVAIDLRHYAFDRVIDLHDDGSRVYADAWLAFVDEAAPYALELAGSEADALKAEAQTAVPSLPANVFLRTLGRPDLYYSLVGVRSDARNTMAALGVSSDDASVVRAGALGGERRLDVVVTRQEQSLHPGRAWWTRAELGATEAHGGLRVDPINLPSSFGEVIFTLPNGMLAFALLSADGQRVAALPKCVVDFSCVEPRAEVSMTCRGCHATGLHDAVDQVRAFATANPDQFEPGMLAQIQAQYPIPSDFAAVLAADDRRHADARRASGIAEQSLDNIGAQYFRFASQPLDLRRAAAELGASPDELASALRAMGPTRPGIERLLEPGASIDRDTFTAHLTALACALPAQRNRPVACTP